MDNFYFCTKFRCRMREVGKNMPRLSLAPIPFLFNFFTRLSNAFNVQFPQVINRRLTHSIRRGNRFSSGNYHTFSETLSELCRSDGWRTYRSMDAWRDFSNQLARSFSRFSSTSRSSQAQRSRAPAASRRLAALRILLEGFWRLLRSFEMESGYHRGLF